MHVILNLVLYVIHVFAHVESKNNIEWNSRSNVYSSIRGSCLKYAEIYKYIELEVYIYTLEIGNVLHRNLSIVQL